MSRNELRFVSLVGDARRASPVQAIANTLDELAPDDVEVAVLDEPRRLPPFQQDVSDAALPFVVDAMGSRITQADAVVFVTLVPGPTPDVLTNALHWLGRCRSRPLAGRAVAVVTASANSSVGPCLHLHRLLPALGATMLAGADVAVPYVDRKVDAGTACLRDEEARQLVGAHLAALANLVRKRRAQSPRSG